jgi:hypothetical protein
MPFFESELIIVPAVAMLTAHLAPWDQLMTAPFTAFVLCCNYEFWQGKRYVDNTLMPFKPYYRLCRAGAEMVWPVFLNFYLKTCFLADRSTTALDLEAGAEWRGTS